VRGIRRSARSRATSSPRGTARAATQPLPFPRTSVTRRQPASLLSIGLCSVCGQLCWTCRETMQELAPSPAHAGIRAKTISSTFRTCVINHAAAAPSGRSPIVATSSGSCGMARLYGAETEYLKPHTRRELLSLVPSLLKSVSGPRCNEFLSLTTQPSKALISKPALA
jgi:hypothetical protein